MRARAPIRPSVPERITLAVSFLAIIALVAVALFAQVRQESEIPGTLSVTFDMERAELRDGMHYVPYVVRNDGSEAIASAKIWFDVFEGERFVESAEVTVQFLPLNGTQTGVYITPLDPETHIIRGRLESLQFP